VDVVEVNDNLVNSSISELLQQLLVLVLGSSSALLVTAAALSRLIVFVHEIILVTQIVFVNGDVAQRGRDGMLGRRLEVFEEFLKGSCKSLLAPDEMVRLPKRTTHIVGYHSRREP
jgi:hypothetical protein